jgi:hypothetical protein
MSIIISVAETYLGVTYVSRQMNKNYCYECE